MTEFYFFAGGAFGLFVIYQLIDVLLTRRERRPYLDARNARRARN